MKKKYIIATGLLLSLGSANHSFGAAATEDTEEQDQQWLGARLIKAVENNDLQTVQELIDQKAPLNYESRKKHTLGMTPLMLASTLGFLDIVNLLLEKKDLCCVDKCNMSDEAQTTALMYAIKEGHNNIVRALILNSTLQTFYGSSGENLHAMAVDRDRNNIDKTCTSMVEVMGNALKKLYRRTKLGLKLIEATKNNDIEQVKKLIALKAPMDLKEYEYGEGGIYDRTPLMCASNKGFLDIVNLLIEAGADLEVKSSNCGETALMIHLQHTPNTEIVKALLKAKAQVNCQNKYQKNTPLMLASHEWMPDTILSCDVINLLIEAKADLEAQDDKGNTALLRTIKDGKNDDIVQTLVFGGASPSARNYAGNTCWDVPINGHYANKTRGQMSQILQQAVDKKQRAESLPAELKQHTLLPSPLIDLVLDYKQKDKRLRTLQKKLMHPQPTLLLVSSEKNNTVPEEESKLDSENNTATQP